MAEQPTIMDRDDILSGLAQWFHSQWDEGHYLEYETNALICSYEEEHEGAAAELAGTIVKAVESGDEDFKKFLAHLYARKFWKMDKPRTSTPVPGLF